MPVYEEPKKKWGWPHYLAIGCGGCLFLAIVCPFLFGLLGFFFYSSKMGSPASHRAGSYHYGSWPQCATATIALPGSYGTLTYRHSLPQGAGSAYDGSRGLKIASPGGAKQEWPLPYSHLSQVKVGVYWHPVNAGKGPFVRFLDASGESVLDLGRREVGSVSRSGGRIYSADYEYNNMMFSTGGKPPADLTGALSSGNSTYLGSIVLSGKKLVFVPAAGKRP